MAKPKKSSKWWLNAGPQKKCFVCKGKGQGQSPTYNAKLKKNELKVIRCGYCSGYGWQDPFQCSYCNGCGKKSDDSYATFDCPWCGGSGSTKDAPKDWCKRPHLVIVDPKKKAKAKAKLEKVDKSPGEPGDGSRWEEI